MTIYTAPNLTSGVDDALYDTVRAVPSFTPFLLFFVFGTVLISGALSQKRRTGYADIPMWSLLASICALMVALFMTLRAGLIDLFTLGVTVAITITCGIWFFMSKGRNEI